MRAKAQKKYNKTPKASARMRKFNSTPKGKANTARQHHARKSRVKNTECTLTAKQWNKIIEMQNNCCNDCGREFSEDLPSTRDHIIPVSKGGGLTFGNVQALCLSCNARKRDKIDFGTAMSKIFVEVI